MPHSSKFYQRSLTLLLLILEMISEGLIITEISRALKIKKSHVFYYIKRAKDQGYVKELTRDRFKILEITQAGNSPCTNRYQICQDQYVELRMFALKHLHTSSRRHQ